MESPSAIREAVQRVFPASEEGFPHWVLDSELEARGLLYLDEAGLSEAQVAAVAAAAMDLGDEGCFVSYVERYEGRADVGQDFALQRLSFTQYRELEDPAVLDHVVVSRSGRWGVFVLHDGVAVVAGPESFVRSLYRTLPPMEEQAKRYAGDILSTKHAGLIAWLRELLTVILGPEDGAAVILVGRDRMTALLGCASARECPLTA